MIKMTKILFVIHAKKKNPFLSFLYVMQMWWSETFFLQTCRVGQDVIKSNQTDSSVNYFAKNMQLQMVLDMKILF